MSFRLPLPDADVSRGHAVNQLDREQYRMRRKQLTFIADSAFQLRETCTDLEEAVEELKTYLASIRSMCFEVFIQKFPKILGSET